MRLESAITLTIAALVCSVAPARANQLSVLITEAQIRAAVTSSTFTGCSAGLTDCGVYAIGLKSDSLGETSATANRSPSSSWAVVSLGSSGGPGYEASGAAAGQTYITANTHVTSSNNYDTNTTPALLKGAGALPVGTTLGWLVTYSTNIAVGVSDTLTLRLFAVQLNATTGAEGNKGLASNVTISTLTSLPEPSSMLLFLGGFAALGVYRLRRRES